MARTSAMAKLVSLLWSKGGSTFCMARAVAFLCLALLALAAAQDAPSSDAADTGDEAAPSNSFVLEELSKKSVGELRRMLLERNLDCDGCKDKSALLWCNAVCAAPQARVCVCVSSHRPHGGQALVTSLLPLAVPFLPFHPPPPLSSLLIGEWGRGRGGSPSLPIVPPDIVWSAIACQVQA